MAIHTTAKYALRYPDLAEAADVPVYIGDLAADADAAFAGWGIDLFANRPAAGKAGKLFYATNTDAMYLDDGSAWHGIALTTDSRLTDQRTPLDGSVTTAKLAASTGSGNVVLSASPTLTGTAVMATIQPTTIQLGGDAVANLYREVASRVKTAGQFASTLDIFARHTAGTEVFIGSIGGQAGLMLGGDVTIQRTSSTSIQTSNSFYAVGNLAGHVGLSAQTIIGGAGPGGESGILFGSAADTYLYRNGAAGLATNSSLNLTTTGALVMWSNAASGSRVLENYLLASDANPSFRIYGNGGIQWGPGGAVAIDTSIGRNLDPNGNPTVGVNPSLYVFADPGGATGDTGLWAYFHGIGARRIIAGAAGSGSNGGGYRQLQILN